MKEHPDNLGNIHDGWLLPDGVEEVLPQDARRIEKLRRRLIDLFDGWGYDLVMPPLVDYLESLLSGTGHDVELKTFTLTDQLTGKMMGVRADMTPQVARMDSHSLQCGEPSRLCYIGSVLHTLPDGLSGQRNPIQVGAELYGHDGIESDAEIISLMLESLKLAGFPNVHVDVGHMGVFRSLVGAAGLSDVIEEQLFAAMQRKATFDLVELLDKIEISNQFRYMFLALVDLNGGTDVIIKAREQLRDAPEAVILCLDRLEKIAELVELRSGGQHLHFDLSELRGYRYEQGVVFAAFVPGRGQEIARGGRYDGIGEGYGHSRPAVGFSTDLKSLINLTQEEQDKKRSTVLAPCIYDVNLVKEVTRLREEGRRVVWVLPDHEGNLPNVEGASVMTKVGEHWMIGTADEKR